ncbi:hypothetical protein ES707_02319 [subsurface metagenome]
MRDMGLVARSKKGGGVKFPTPQFNLLGGKVALCKYYS